MKSNFGKIIVALKDKEDHAATLLNYIASACHYEKDRIYDTRKGERAYMLRKTGIKHKTSYNRAVAKLVRLGLIHQLQTALGRSYAMYILTEETVRLAEEYNLKTKTHKRASNP